MEITIQPTTNPKVIKFVAESPLIDGSLELDRNSDVSHIPLAQELFQFPFITRLFITANFIAVAKEDFVEWSMVEESLKEIIAQSITQYPSIILPKKEETTLFYTERTPNPQVVKFVSEKQIIKGFLEVKSPEDSRNIQLTKQLFKDFAEISEIFINDNYISITKTKETDWDNIMPSIQKSLEEYFQNQQKAEKIRGIVEKYQAQSFNNRGFTEMEEKINAILQEYVAPAVESDGGKISLIEYDEETKTAKMLLQGACSGCPSSAVTLKNGIEKVLKNFLPDVVESVEAING